MRVRRVNSRGALLVVHDALHRLQGRALRCALASCGTTDRRTYIDPTTNLTASNEDLAMTTVTPICTVLRNDFHKLSDHLLDAVTFDIRRAPLVTMNETDADPGERDHATATAVWPLLLTALQAAEMLAIGRTSVYELIAAGDLETVHIGSSMRIPADSVHTFVALRRRRP